MATRKTQSDLVTFDEASQRVTEELVSGLGLDMVELEERLEMVAVADGNCCLCNQTCPTLNIGCPSIPV